LERKIALVERPQAVKVPVRWQWFSANNPEPLTRNRQPGPARRSNALASKLDSKIAVVTGGSAGTGLGTAKRFVEEGAEVFITGRREGELDKLLPILAPT
jgi:hypothetical protein